MFYSVGWRCIGLFIVSGNMEVLWDVFRNNSAFFPIFDGKFEFWDFVFFQVNRVVSMVDI